MGLNRLASTAVGRAVVVDECESLLESVAGTTPPLSLFSLLHSHTDQTMVERDVGMTFVLDSDEVGRVFVEQLMPNNIAKHWHLQTVTQIFILVY